MRIVFTPDQQAAYAWALHEPFPTWAHRVAETINAFHRAFCVLWIDAIKTPQDQSTETNQYQTAWMLHYLKRSLTRLADALVAMYQNQTSTHTLKEVGVGDLLPAFKVLDAPVEAQIEDIELTIQTYPDARDVLDNLLPRLTLLSTIKAADLPLTESQIREMDTIERNIASVHNLIPFEG